MRGPANAALLITGGKPPNVRLTEEERTDLLNLFASAEAAVQAPAAGSRKIISDLWNGVPVTQNLTESFTGFATDPMATYEQKEKDAYAKNIRDAAEGGSRVPKFAANILQVGTRILASSILPTTPTLHAQTQTVGVSELARNQNALFRIAAEHGGLAAASAKAIFTGILDTHFGLRVDVVEDHEEEWKRLQWFAVDAEACGEEPGLKRFRWHRYKCQFDDLDEYCKRIVNKDRGPQGIAPKIKPYETVYVTEIYHTGLAIGHERNAASVVIDAGGADRKYIGTWKVSAVPVVVKSLLQPAPGCEVAFSEAHSFLPPIQMMSEILFCIHTQVATGIRIRLFDGAVVSREDLEDAITNQNAAISWIEVNTKNVNDALGVNQRVRPLENDTNLGDLLAAFNLSWRLVGYIMGFSDIDFGDAPSPRKSATEATAIDAHLSQRRKERLEVLVSAIKESTEAGMKLQRRAYGKEIKGPDGTTFEVPAYKPGRVAIRIDPVELGHLSLRDDASNLLSFVQLIGNLRAQFPAAMPSELRSPLSKIATMFGEHDLAAMLSMPEMNEGPRDRFIQAMVENTPISVQEGDDPAMFVPYYRQLLGSLGNTAKIKFGGLVVEAIEKLQALQKQRAIAAGQEMAADGSTQSAPVGAIPFPTQFRRV